MCKNCIIAGRLLAGSRGLGESAARGQRQQVAYWHSRCLQPTTCTCQHLVPVTA